MVHISEIHMREKQRKKPKVFKVEEMADNKLDSGAPKRHNSYSFLNNLRKGFL
jgi:hypothetical protein